ncbi:MAG TPA: hypothetical protein VFT72_04570 [Opitutaceae bacterium]|nr:hypothetical protein [Opitutaceae bacterium]
MREKKHGLRIVRSPALLVIVSLMSSIVTAKDEPRATAVHVLRRGDTLVEVMDPNAPDRYNVGTRFSPVANVLSVRVGEKRFLFAPAAHDPLTENGGLAMEFDLQTRGGPPGFSEAGVGEGYLKIGVGILRKESASYNFFACNESIERARTRVEWRTDSASFEQTSPAVNGYCYALAADVRVRPGEVGIEYRLTNTGAKAFATEQYAHNYFWFDETPVGPDYALEFPFDIDVSGAAPSVASVARVGRTLRISAPLSGPINLKITRQKPSAEPEAVVVRDRRSGLSVEASVSRPAAHISLHATERYLCPEQFVALRLAPGESAAWTRLYRFNHDASVHAASNPSH